MSAWKVVFNDNCFIVWCPNCSCSSNARFLSIIIRSLQPCMFVLGMHETGSSKHNRIVLFTTDSSSI